MLDSEGGGGFAGTNWNAHDTPDMWRQLQNQDTDPYWTHVSGLRKISELTSTHLSRVKEYRDNLATAWPPEKSAASAAFISRLDYLVAHIQQTHDTAVANYTTVSTTAAALMTARHDLKAVYDDYVKVVQQKKDYDEAVSFQLASDLPGTSLGDPPVTADDIETVNNKARVIMFDLSATLTQAQAGLQRPVSYKPPTVKRDDTTSGGSGGSPPALPLVVALPPPAPAVSSSVASPLAAVPTSAAPGMGPILGGSAPVPAAPPSPTTEVIMPPTQAPAPAGSGFVPTVPGVIPGARSLPGVTTSPPLAKPGGIGRPATTAPFAGVPPRAMPPGGLIGGPPGAGLARPSATGPMRRVNPVGGVIGNEPVGRTGPGITPATGQAARASGTRASSGRGPSASRTGSPARELGRLSGGRPNSLVADASEPLAPGRAGPQQSGGSGRPGTISKPAGVRPAVTFSASDLPPGVTQLKRADGSIIRPDQQRPAPCKDEEDDGGRRWDPYNPWQTAVGVAPVLRPSENDGRIDPGPAIGFDL
jgi:hypothetical protein